MIIEFMKKILFVNINGDLSGAENSLLNLMTNLDRTKIQPLLICSYNGVFTELAMEHGIDVRIIPLEKDYFSYSPVALWRQSRLLLNKVRIIMKMLDEESIDLIHVNTYKIALPYSLAARLARIPVVWHLRDMLEKPKIQREFFGFLFRTLPNKVIAVSDACANQFGSDFNRKIARIYNGIDADEFNARANRKLIRNEFGLSEETIIVGCVGQLIAWKGQDIFLKAMALIAKKCRNIRFLIVGSEIVEEESFEENLRKLTTELGLDGFVIFAGFRRDIPSLISAMDVFVHCPIKPDPLPRVILEAMALNLPIVATHTGGIPELVKNGKNGILVPPADEKALANGVLWMISNPAHAICLGKEGRHRLQGFSIQQHVDQVMTVYNNLMHGASTH